MCQARETSCGALCVRHTRLVVPLYVSGTRLVVPLSRRAAQVLVVRLGRPLHSGTASRRKHSRMNSQALWHEFVTYLRALSALTASLGTYQDMLCERGSSSIERQ